MGKPVLIVRLIPNQRCAGCMATNCYVDDKNRFCCYCLGFSIATADRQRKLGVTLWGMFAKRIGAHLQTKRIA
jgi:hypothetical protein